MIFQTLYKRDRAGKIRTWAVEQDGSRYRYITGLQDGALVTSGWTQATAASQTTDELQANFEVASTYTHQLARDYFETIGEVDTPRIFEPMLADKYKKFAPGYSQPKLDGMRCIAKTTGLFSRQGKPILSCPHIIEALEPFFEKFPDAILDGEVYNHDLKSEFEELMSLARKGAPQPGSEKLQYHVYDYPSAPGGFGARTTQLLLDLAPSNLIHLVETWEVFSEGTFDRLFETWLDAGYEGGMWRDADGEYVIGGRPKFLQKRVLMMSEEFKFVRLEDGNGNWAGVPKSVVCELPTGREFSAGIKGTRDQNLALRDRKISEVTISFKGWTGYGIPRCGVAKDFHTTTRID